MKVYISVTKVGLSYLIETRRLNPRSGAVEGPCEASFTGTWELANEERNNRVKNWRKQMVQLTHDPMPARTAEPARKVTDSFVKKKLEWYEVVQVVSRRPDGRLQKWYDGDQCITPGEALAERTKLMKEFPDTEYATVRKVVEEF